LFSRGDEIAPFLFEVSWCLPTLGRIDEKEKEAESR
jgi:hypothetical protein